MGLGLLQHDLLNHFLPKVQLLKMSKILILNLPLILVKMLYEVWKTEHAESYILAKQLSFACQGKLWTSLILTTAFQIRRDSKWPKCTRHSC